MIKAKSQLEKRIDAQGSGGGISSIADGIGTYVNSYDGGITPRVNIKAANDVAGERGGVRLNWLSADTGLTAGEGKYSDGGFLGLKVATAKQKGGLTLGDGLVPANFVKKDGNWGVDGSIVKIRLGKGLAFSENPSGFEDTDGQIIGGNTFGGRPISISIGKGLGFDADGNLIVKLGNGFIVEADGSISTVDYVAGNGIKLSNHAISVKIGEGLEFDDDGIINVTATGGGSSYTAGDGIEITDGGEGEEPKISAKIGEGLEIGEEGEIKALANIENAVIISEADAKYLLHNYTQVEYISGNKIGYAGGQNQIVVQNLITYKLGGTAPNGVAIKSGNNYSADEGLIANIPVYGDMSFKGETYSTTGGTHPKMFTLRHAGSTTTYDTYQIVQVNDDDTESTFLTFNNYDNYLSYGFALLWQEIHPPGFAVGDIIFPFGCARCSMAIKFKRSATEYQLLVHANAYFYIGFSSESDYKSAIGLTYERQDVMAEVNDTVTEV